MDEYIKANTFVCNATNFKFMIMKKVLLTLGLAMSVVLAGNAYGQDVDKKSNETKPVQKEVKATDQQTPAIKTTQQQPQNKPAPKQMSTEERAKKQVERISTKVKDLTPEQTKKLTDLHKTSLDQLEKDKVTYKDDKEKMKDVMKGNYERINNGIKEILTPEQFKTYTEASRPPQNPGTEKNTGKPQPPKEAKPNTDADKK